MQTAIYSVCEKDRFKRGRGWKVNLMGTYSEVPGDGRQAFRIDMSANMVLDAHLHVVDQFQIFVAGSGKIGRDAADVVTAHYADHHTGYGPLVAGDQGMSYLTLRSKTDAGMVKLKTPDIRDRLRPTKRRHRMSSPVTLSIPPVLKHRENASIETIMPDKPGDDGMTAKVVRLGMNMSLRAPDGAGTGGYYVVVLNGSLQAEGEILKPFSLVWVATDDEPPVLQAGEDGLEALMAIFPVQDEWMRDLV